MIIHRHEIKINDELAAGDLTMALYHKFDIFSTASLMPGHQPLVRNTSALLKSSLKFILNQGPSVLGRSADL